MSIKTWFAFIALVLTLQSKAYAEEVVTTIFNVIESVRTERLLVLSGSDGRIYKTSKSEANLKYFKSFQGKVVKLNYEERGKEAIITGIRAVTAAEVDPTVYDLNHFQYNQLRQFAPTDLKSIEEATEIFDGMLNDGDRRRSQCFKRAHMWAYDMWSKLGVYSQKIFIFYTKRYSILEDFEWWFHVAPMVVVNGQEYVLDGTFMSKPIPVLEWKNYFIKSNKVTCPVIENYKTYEEKQWSRLCFLMKTPMYYFSPLTIQDRDKRGIERNFWVLEELQDARRAFKNFVEVYEGLDTGKPTITY
jgi:hypothetical protein